MGSSNHLKRLAMPRSWPLPRKTTIWVTRPAPGAHSLDLCMPINLVIRDVLGLAHSTREVRHILHNGLAKVDGRICKDTRRGVGLMDVLSLGDVHYRCVLDTTADFVTVRFPQLRLNGRFAESKARAPSKVARLNSTSTTVETSSLTMQQSTLLEAHSNSLCQAKRSLNTSSSLKASAATSSVVLTLAALQT